MSKTADKGALTCHRPAGWDPTDPDTKSDWEVYVGDKKVAVLYRTQQGWKWNLLEKQDWYDRGTARTKDEALGQLSSRLADHGMRDYFRKRREAKSSPD